MTPEEAMKLIDIDDSIKHLEECKRFAVFAKKEDDIKMLKRAIEAFTITSTALKKQIPKKVKEELSGIDNQIDFLCPECNSYFLDRGSYCSSCGQALDWSDEE